MLTRNSYLTNYLRIWEIAICELFTSPFSFHKILKMRGANLFYSFYFAISAQSNKNNVRFPAIGDWGGSDYIIFPDGNTFTQEYGAASMGKAKKRRGLFQCEILDRLCGEKECDFLLSLGDNFYTEGVKDIDDTRFHFTYELVYGKASEREVLKTLDFYQCLGNHDHRDNATAQVRLEF